VYFQNLDTTSHYEKMGVAQAWSITLLFQAHMNVEVGIFTVDESKPPQQVGTEACSNTCLSSFTALKQGTKL
jgi:hypothetical protein